MTAISTALSGLQAGTARLNATASNVANTSTTGRVPATSPVRAGMPGGAQAYQPIDTVEITGAGGGVETTYRPRKPSHGVAYDPDSPFADAGGLVAAPNLDPAAETVEQIVSLRSFQLNAAVLRSAGQMAQSTLDIFA